MAATTLPTRAELDATYTWDLAALYPDERAYRDDFTAAARQIDELAAFAGRLGSSAGLLADFFEDYWSLVARLQRLRNFASLPLTVDQGDQSARQRAGQFEGLQGRFSMASAFVAPELLGLGRQRLAELAAEDKRLSYLNSYFDRLERQRPHVRSSEVEEVLGGSGEPFEALERAYNSLVNGELPFAPVSHGGQTLVVARSTYPKLRMARDRELRRKAYHAFHDGFLAFDDTIAELYLGRVKQSVFLARARGYEDTVQEQLAPREVPRAVLDAVVGTFEAKLGVWHRYWEARRRLLGLEELAEWDIFAPLSSAPMQVPYAQGVQWIVAGMSPLGEEYLGSLREGLFTRRWVDVYPNLGKRDGAFCSHAYGVQPQIMISYQDDLESVSTLAHELGHAMHAVLMDEAQPLPYANYAMMVAETASNFNQALVRAHLLDRLKEPADRLAVLDEAFHNFHRYFFIMPTLVRLELAVHAAVERGEGLSSTKLNVIMRDLFQEGYGDHIRADERTGVTWAQFGHLYQPFYTFQYAAGIAAAAALADDVHRGRPGAVERYLGLLRAGSSVSPIEAMKVAGVDLTTAEPIERAFAVLEGYVEQLEDLARQQGN
ncbi:MAG TPA: M3 family oligoendopeptidase [Trueperaceae bacterium]|nr:M3 family oligoendopeptidase [Trueperaceae bacterium]